MGSDRKLHSVVFDSATGSIWVTRLVEKKLDDEVQRQVSCFL